MLPFLLSTLLEIQIYHIINYKIVLNLEGYKLILSSIIILIKLRNTYNLQKNQYKLLENIELTYLKIIRIIVQL